MCKTYTYTFWRIKKEVRILPTIAQVKKRTLFLSKKLPVWASSIAQPYSTVAISVLIFRIIIPLDFFSFMTCSHPDTKQCLVFSVLNLV